MTDDLIQHVNKWLQTTAGQLKEHIPTSYQGVMDQEPFLLAVSGGVDSMVLLDIFYQLAQSRHLSFSVIHINHQLREVSDREQEMVIQFCEDRQIELQVVAWAHEDPNHPNRSELAAREFRYAVFEKIMTGTQTPYLVTAHHQNDQAETIMMRLVHGNRLASVAGIHPYRPIDLGFGLKTGFVLRPLLDLPKSALYQYAKENDIPFSEDQSNSDETYTRNRFRQQFIPLLEKEDDNLLDHLSEFGQASQATVFFAQKYMDELLKKVVEKKDGTWQVDLTGLSTYDEGQQVLLWQRLFENTRIKGLASFTQKGFHQLVAFLNEENGQGEWQLPAGYRLVKVYDTAYILANDQSGFFQSEEDLGESSSRILTFGTWINLGEQGELGWFDNDQLVDSTVIEVAKLSGQQKLWVRHRQTGDYIRLHNGHRQKLNRYFINEKVPIVIRDQALLVVDENQEVSAVLFDGQMIYQKMGAGTSKVLLKF